MPRGPPNTCLAVAEMAVPPVPPLDTFEMFPTPEPIAHANRAPGRGAEGTPRAAWPDRARSRSTWAIR